ncbi:putative Ig domain-containing protein [Dactylosporangium sp. CA-233914]|uniref:putative Ig domain-containing protein n=1 Tax=Dactylosporangium sp. CA-233914 TaxID=3239934 RepID=UPI003D8E76E5
MKLPRLSRAPRLRRDAGFSLVETLTSIAVMGVVMTALTTFFVSTMNTINKQRGTQMAIRLASDAIEQVKSLPGSSLAVGRGATDVNAMFDTGTTSIPGLDLATLKASMTPVVDSTLTTGDSKNPVLPVKPEALTVNDVAFKRYWFVGRCTITPALDTASLPCVASADLTLLQFFRVVVAVTWQDSRECAGTGGKCSYVTDTLVSASSTDPVFNPSVTIVPPLPDNPGNQASDLNVPINPVNLTASTSYPPLTWSVLGLPPGVTANDSGNITGTPTAAGTYVVRITVKDQASANDASFNWVVNALPAIPQPPDQTWDAGAKVSYQVPLTGGTGPMQWSATGLPSGLSIDAATGLVTGTTTASGAESVKTVTVGVKDSFGKTASATFKWITKAQVTTKALTPTKGQPFSVQVAAAGGTGPYTFSASNLPTGLTISSSGVVSGTAGVATRFFATINVTDSKGVTNSAVVPVNVTTLTGLTITSPTFDNADRSSPKGTALSATAGTTLTAASSGGTGTVRWSLVQTLPTGLSLSATGAITGTPTATGTWQVILKATDGASNTAVFAFRWTIT